MAPNHQSSLACQKSPCGQQHPRHDGKAGNSTSMASRDRFSPASRVSRPRPFAPWLYSLTSSIPHLSISKTLNPLLPRRRWAARWKPIKVVRALYGAKSIEGDLHQHIFHLSKLSKSKKNRTNLRKTLKLYMESSLSTGLRQTKNEMKSWSGFWFLSIIKLFSLKPFLLNISKFGLLFTYLWLISPCSNARTCEMLSNKIGHFPRYSISSSCM